MENLFWLNKLGDKSLVGILAKKVFMSQEISDVLFVCEDKNILDALKEEVITSSTRKGVFYFRRLEHRRRDCIN